MSLVSHILLAALVTTCGLAASAEEKAPQFLHDVRLAVPAGFDSSKPLVLDLYSDDIAALRSRLTGHTIRAEYKDRLVVEVVASPDVPVKDGELDAYRASTFLIDYESPEVVALRDEVAARLGRAPTTRDLVRFVQEKIRPSLDHGYEHASKVAGHLEGDCTEHSVIYAALARSFAFPARLVSGTVIVESEREGVRAYGHAWNEVYDGKSWKIVDSTPLGDMRPLGYVPDYRAKNEGPGYGLELITGIAHGVSRVEISTSGD
jgi:transglutaminase-like putative cysteine protease